MSESSLPVAIENRSLFSDHFLRNRLPKQNDWEETGDLEDAFESIRQTYNDRSESLETANESQTQNDFIDPVLEALGWEYDPEMVFAGNEPDYCFFTSDAQKQSASPHRKDDKSKYFEIAASIGEAKYWGRPLEGPGDEERDPSVTASQQTPANQIYAYVSESRLRWGILTNGARWRLYSGDQIDPGRYYAVDLEHILSLEDEEEALEVFKYFYLFFRASAQVPHPDTKTTFLDSVVKGSVQYGTEVEEKLKGLVFEEVFPTLAKGMRANAGNDRYDEPDELYRATLRLLYRLLFLFHAEDRELLPVGQMGSYSLSAITRDIKDDIDGEEPLLRASGRYWRRLSVLFDIVEEGRREINLPQYNGGLFDPSKKENDLLNRLEIGDSYLAPALDKLAREEEADDGPRTFVDYSSLDVEQLGSIYEGLLEYRLEIADQDLAVTKDNGNEVYVPLSEESNPIDTIDEGELYLVKGDNERKTTGSYYTPHYIVEYISKQALRPVIERRKSEFREMAERLEQLKTRQNGEKLTQEIEALEDEMIECLLSLRVCDPAMGSGHFLVYASKWIAGEYSKLLNEVPKNPVTEKLDEMKSRTLNSLRDDGIEVDESKITRVTLLQRLVMKRCIYGVDKNPLAVELAKLSLWLHSFTVGAPLSFLDHHLKRGNSLIGASVEEVRTELEANGPPQNLFDGPFSGLAEVTELMQDVARRADATLSDVEQSLVNFGKYEEAVRPYQRALDMWVSRALGNDRAEDLLRGQGGHVLDIFRGEADPKGEAQEEVIEKTVQVSKEHNPFHWELEFPEVYFDLTTSGRKADPGFDAVIGNPPYGYRVTAEIDPYLRESYGKAESENIAEYFVEQCFRILKRSSNWGMIIPKQVLHTPTWSDVRARIHGASRTAKTIVDVSEAFEEVLLEQVVVLASPGETERVRIGKITDDEIDDSYSIESRKLTNDLWPIYAFDEFEDIFDRIHSASELLGDLSDLYFGIKNIKSKLTKDKGIPIIEGDNISRYEIIGDLKYLPTEKISDEWKERYLMPKLVVQRIVAHVTKPYPHIIVMASNDKEGRLAFDTTTVVRSKITEYSDDFLLAIINSRYTSWYLHRFVYNFSTRTMGFRDGFADKLPIRKISFNTPEAKREQYVENLVVDYESLRDGDDPSCDAVLSTVDTHLSANPERAGVIHDLLAHLAREMTELTGKKQSLQEAFDPFKYLPRNAGAKTFAEVFSDEIKYGELLDGSVDLTTEQHNIDKARLVEKDGSWNVEVRLMKRDPENWEEWQKENGNIVREWVSAFRLRQIDDHKAQYYRYALPRLEEFTDDEFSGTIFPGGFTRTVRKRLLKTPVPEYNPAVDLGDLIDLDQEQEEVRRTIEFTDGLIDQIVYRLYDLSDDEIELVEMNTSYIDSSTVLS